MFIFAILMVFFAIICSNIALAQAATDAAAPAAASLADCLSTLPGIGQYAGTVLGALASFRVIAELLLRLAPVLGGIPAFGALAPHLETIVWFLGRLFSLPGLGTPKPLAMAIAAKQNAKDAAAAAKPAGGPPEAFIGKD